MFEYLFVEKFRVIFVLKFDQDDFERLLSGDLAKKASFCWDFSLSTLFVFSFTYAVKVRNTLSCHQVTMIQYFTTSCCYTPFPYINLGQSAYIDVYLEPSSLGFLYLWGFLFVDPIFENYFLRPSAGAQCLSCFGV